MKKIYIVLICLLTVGYSFGHQNLTLNQNEELETFMPDNNNPGKSYNQLKGDGDVFWTESFNWANPDDIKGWTLPEGWEIGEEGEDFGHFWMWRNDTIRGKYSTISPRTWFETEEDGFFVLPMDEYNYIDAVSTSNDCNSWFQTPVIDCSDKPSVVFQMKQYFRVCCGSRTQKLEVTNDGGVHWAEFDLEYGTINNNTPPQDGRHVVINISNVAAGQSEVQLRITWEGSRRYYWIIDDMKLAEAYHNEIKMEDSWAYLNDGDDDDDEGFINYIPLSQINESFGGYSFRSAVINDGIDDQSGVHMNVDVMKNGVSVYNENSEERDMISLARDTFNIINEFLADDYGDYSIQFTNLMNNEDQIADNNSSELFFTVNDSLYMRSDKSNESAAGTNGFTWGKNSGDIVGNVITITNPVEASSITAYIDVIGLDVQSNSHYVQYMIFKEDLEGDEEWIEVISSEYTELEDGKKDYWLSLPLEKDGESEFLVAGNYMVGVALFGEAEGQDIRLGYDQTTYCPSSKTRALPYQGEAWKSTNGKLKMIGLNTTERGGPTVAPVTFNVDLNEEIEASLFNPASDFIDITGTFNNWGASEAFTDADGDGIYSLTISDLSTGENIEYKYRINANVVIPEVDNRTYQVGYWNIIDNSFRFDATIGIEKQDIENSLSVYPNPTTGMINVVVNNSKQSDLTIEMRDVQGQLVYTNKVNSVLNHREVIDINIAKGMYFLSVNNGNDINVKKVIVQ